MKSDSEPQSQEQPLGESSDGDPTDGGNHSAAPGSVPPGSVPPGSAQPGSAQPGCVASVEELEAELARTRERLLRTAADFDNYRKRSRKDITEAERRVQENLLQALVPPFDNLARAATHAESTEDVKALAEGLKMVLRQFEDALSTVGIQRIVSIGKPFDPAEHEAVQHIDTDEVPPGAVAQELRAGYRWNDRLIRPALVVVSRAPAAPRSEAGNDA